MRVILGYEPREDLAYRVAEASIHKHASRPVIVRKLDIAPLVAAGLYTRPTDRRDGRLWDVISDAPMSTEHANARFLTPAICSFTGWALFADCDILVRSDITRILDHADDKYAVMVVQHRQEGGAVEKMDGQVQQFYARKNWSSVCLWNCEHPANRVLRFGLANRWPGRDLHAFRWLQDAEIGALPPEWNYLVGVNKRASMRQAFEGEYDHTTGQFDLAAWVVPHIAHFTLGTPDMPGYAEQEYADEWRALAVEVAGQSQHRRSLLNGIPGWPWNSRA